MTQNLQDLEKDIEQSRARLDVTIDRLQDRMTVSGVVDDVLGTARSSRYGPLFDDVLNTIRRNPVPVMLIAAGLGLLAYRLGRPPSAARRRARVAADYDFVTDQDFVTEPEDPRLYGAGASPLQPAGEMSERHRSMNSRI